MAADIDGTLAVFAVAAWADGDEGRRTCAQALDAYIEAVGGSASDRYDALQKLHREARSIVGSQDHSAMIMKLINVRLTEVTASMVGVGVPSVSSPL
ncbi:hypothetical protein [Chenggangzhangella methanolivorans]|uniref:Uncharacterized protein n=1 Tax=Chenggangzhangella methanolivorans TaxID=1437009 RepID=A0A9E6RC48_9HYPH|nr:hypothetical protein [Chenggangzhangella methanolivorans]QZO02114.1 hypothetical protein K6K41_13090 [Chenggangzhangella methanolivorans]